MNVVPHSRAGGLAVSLNRGAMLRGGALLIILGSVGIMLSYLFTGVALFWFGLIAIIAGLGELLEAYHDGGWAGRISHTLTGLFYLAAGGALILFPASAAYWLTLVLALSFIGSGLVRAFRLFALRGERVAQLMLLVFSIVSIGFGIYILRNISPPGPDALASLASQRAWMRSWGWILGLFIAIEAISQGISLIYAAVTSRGRHASALQHSTLA